VLYRRIREGQTLTPIIYVDFIPNTSYFGRLIISGEEIKGDPRLIKKPLKEIAEGRLLQEINETSEIDVPATLAKDNQAARRSRQERLCLVDKPPNLSRAVIHCKVSLPLFKGEGNTNYLCGQCGVVIAEYAWKFSISNIVVECASCHSFNEFPELKPFALPVFGSVGLAKGDYDLYKPIILKRGAWFIGLQ
jgi:hypothetical protein